MSLSKANATSFDCKAIELAISLGAKKDDALSRTYMSDVCVFETSAGIMQVAPDSFWVRGKLDGLFTVNCQFHDVKRARELLLGNKNFNPCSGVYNFDAVGSCSDHIDVALAMFRRHLRPVGI